MKKYQIYPEILQNWQKLFKKLKKKSPLKSFEIKNFGNKPMGLFASEIFKKLDFIRE